MVYLTIVTTYNPVNHNNKASFNILILTCIICLLVWTSWTSVNQMPNSTSLGLYLVLFVLWSLQYSHPNSQKTRRISILIEKCVIFLQSFTSLDKFFLKALIVRLKTRRVRAQNNKWRRTRVLLFFSRMRRLNAHMLFWQGFVLFLESEKYSISLVSFS